MSEIGNETAGDPTSISNVWWTIPNGICVIRILGAPVLVWLAIGERPLAFVSLYLFLAFTDWLDGKLAILLNQRSAIGPKLDTISDVAMYTCLLFGLGWLKADFFLREAGWIVAGAITYATTVGISLAKFQSFPSYHTRAAKVSWGLAIVAIVMIFLDGSPWPFRIAAAAVCLVNLETSLMSLLLKHRQTDVATLFHALARDRSRANK